MNFISAIMFGQNKNDSVQIPFNCLCQIEGFNGQEVYNVVETMPSYSDGEVGLMRLIFENISQPSNQLERQTKIYLTFVIDTLGNARNKCIENPYYPNKLTKLERAALQSLDKMKNWNPGEQAGKKVLVKYNLPIIVELH